MTESTAAWSLSQRLVQRPLLDQLPERIGAWLSSVRLIPLRKPNGKVRHLGLGHTIRRIGARALTGMFGGQAQSAAGPQQYGLGERQGAEMVHKIAAAALAARPDQGLLSLDIAAALISIRKAEVSNAVQKISRLTLWFAGIMNHRPTASCKVGVGELDMSLIEGLDQGCPLSHLFFCAGTAAWIKAIERVAKSVDPNAVVLA